MKNKPQTESGAFQEGMNHGLSSSEAVETSMLESERRRKPLHSADVSGKDKEGIVPFSVIQAQKHIEELKPAIEGIREERIARELRAGHLPKPWPWFVALIVLVILDALLNAPHH